MSMIEGPLVIALCSASVALLLFLVLVRPGLRWRRRSHSTALAVAAGVGALVGAAATWLTDDVLNLVGVDFSFATRLWIAATFAGVAVALCSFWRSRWYHKALGLCASVVFLMTGAVGINIDFGTYPTVNSLLGVSPYDSVSVPALAAAHDYPSPLSASWSAPADMPATGMVASVSIPATVSGFVARKALVYLPPAALTASPPVLPVVITLSGQPGSPSDPLVSGHLIESLDTFAQAHSGLAPIVVSPDQLGDAQNNPMCVDGALGNSATYLTVDVVNWIRSSLPVAAPGPEWGIAGFSQGGTCSIQLGAGHPELFGAILDVSGELVPANGEEQETIDSGFAGSRAAYLAALPESILKARAPYSTFAVFSAGQNDTIYQPDAVVMSDAARAAGMTVSYFVAPDSAHDYTTATYAFGRGFAELSAHWGL
ncbi:alpha/beta hydrolase [Subtercola frigoramans]|uniref:Enterochelin esterase-like enzyme n=2 Tax=Subtercola frigoramans TaxID=120298 RepID=A0ABS2L4N6_9MICO|nr:enterochelin esterase-like enzyme [Subtercola frigoramans]